MQSFPGECNIFASQRKIIEILIFLIFSQETLGMQKLCTWKQSLLIELWNGKKIMHLQENVKFCGGTFLTQKFRSKQKFLEEMPIFCKSTPKDWFFPSLLIFSITMFP